MASEPLDDCVLLPEQNYTSMESQTCSVATVPQPEYTCQHVTVETLPQMDTPTVNLTKQRQSYLIYLTNRTNPIMTFTETDSNYQVGGVETVTQINSFQN